MIEKMVSRLAAEVEAEIARLGRENSRLRAALSEIAYSRILDDSYHILHEIARDALERGDQSTAKGRDGRS